MYNVHKCTTLLLYSILINQEQKRIEESGTDESWKKYLAEMKSYEEHLCIDKDSSARPLVK